MAHDNSKLTRNRQTLFTKAKNTPFYSFPVFTCINRDTELVISF